MQDGREDKITCPICREPRAEWEMIAGNVISPTLVEIIRRQHPDWSEQQVICAACLAESRTAFISRVMQEELEKTEAEMKEMDAQLAEIGELEKPVSRNIAEELAQSRTLSERISDGVTSWVGSWSFFAANIVFLAIWMAFNSVAIFAYHFDPYPFIFLNLVISWISVLEAPLIMMSQNRQDTRDRYRDEHDYRVNLAAETEIRMLHRKMDQLLLENWPRLVEIQRMQMELMERAAQVPPPQDEGQKAA